MIVKEVPRMENFQQYYKTSYISSTKIFRFCHHSSNNIHNSIVHTQCLRDIWTLTEGHIPRAILAIYPVNPTQNVSFPEALFTELLQVYLLYLSSLSALQARFPLYNFISRWQLVLSNLFRLPHQPWVHGRDKNWSFKDDIN